MGKKTQKELAEETAEELKQTEKELKKTIDSKYIFLLGIAFGVLGTPKTSAIIFAAIPPIGPPRAVPIVGATAPTRFFNISFILRPYI